MIDLPFTAICSSCIAGDVAASVVAGGGGGGVAAAVNCCWCVRFSVGSVGCLCRWDDCCLSVRELGNLTLPGSPVGSLLTTSMVAGSQRSTMLERPRSKATITGWC